MLSEGAWLSLHQLSVYQKLLLIAFLKSEQKLGRQKKWVSEKGLQEIMQEIPARPPTKQTAWRGISGYQLVSS